MKNYMRLLFSGLLLTVALNGGASEIIALDCVGIRPGMSVAEARDAFKSYDTNLTVQAGELQIPSLSEKPVLDTLFVVRAPVLSDGSNDFSKALPLPRFRTNSAPVPAFGSNGTIQPSPMLQQNHQNMFSRPGSGEPTETLIATIALPPSEPVVCKVVRSLRFEPGHEQVKSNLLDALHGKYGKESHTIDPGIGGITRFWVFGADKRLLEESEARESSTFWGQSYRHSLEMDSNILVKTMPGNEEFTRQMRTMMFLSGVRNVRPPLRKQEYFQSMTYIVAELTLADNRELVTKMRVSIIDAQLERKATEATRAVIKGAEEVKSKQEKVPKL